MSSNNAYVIRKVSDNCFEVRYIACADNDVPTEDLFLETTRDNLESAMNYINEMAPTKYGVTYPAPTLEVGYPGVVKLAYRGLDAPEPHVATALVDRLDETREPGSPDAGLVKGSETGFHWATSRIENMPRKRHIQNR